MYLVQESRFASQDTGKIATLGLMTCLDLIIYFPFSFNKFSYARKN